MRLLDRLYWTSFLAANMWGQARYPFRPLPAIAQDRDHAVRRMISHAFRCVPYYRRTLLQAGLAPGDFQGFDDLAKLPLIDASTVLAAPTDFLATTADLRHCVSLKTSASSGMSRTIHVDRAALFRNAAQGERERSMMAAAVGRRSGYREAVIVLNSELAESSTPRVQRFLRENAFFPPGVEIERIYLDATEPPQALLPQLNRFQPDIIQGYGASIDALLDHVASTGEAFRPPRAVYFHSDGLTARTRAALQSLGVPVFSTYEACEALKIGFECDAHQGYHVNIDTYPIRIVDGASRDLPAGGTGRVVVSNLSNRAMVLLNYELGDRATWLADRCRCGRTLPRLALLEGSPVESIKLPSGRTVSVIQIYRLFLGDPALRGHQVVHVSPGHFRLLLVVPAVAEQAACGTRIAQAFRTLFADEASAEVVFLERIPLSRGGKKRSFVPLGG